MVRPTPRQLEEGVAILRRHFERAQPVRFEWRWKPPHPQSDVWCSVHPMDTPERVAADGRFEVRALYAVPFRG